MSAARAPSSGAIDAFLESLRRLALIVGKGGVGKTTSAIGIAAHCAARGEKTLLISTDPANSLGPSLDIALVNGERREVQPALWAMQLDPAAARQRFLTQWRDVLVTIIDRGTYLDSDDVGGLVDAAFPGSDEIFGLLVLAESLGEGRDGAEASWQRIVIDTAPTGHTLRLLALPETFDALIALLDAMQAKHRFMVSALTHRYRRDVADEFLDTMRATLAELRLSLGDVGRSGAVLVTRAEPVVVRETERYAEALAKLGIGLVAIVVEALPTEPRRRGAIATSLAELGSLAPEGRLFAVPMIDPPPAGLADAARAVGSMVLVERKRVRSGGKRLGSDRDLGVSLKRGGLPAPRNSDKRAPFPLGTLLRTLTIVGGKGGVGKTTVSCALSLYAALDAQPPAEVLLVSTDPAPSLGDAFGIRTDRWAHTAPVPVESVPRLHVWQMDATAAFQDLRDRYRDRIDAVFDSLMGRSFDIAYERAILRDLLALAPPGIDELYALASLGEAIDEGRYARIVVDPAPTGHLLRLLQLPGLAIDWSHRLMRLILKYKEIAALGDAAQDLLTFVKRTRALDNMLHDESRAGVVLVSLDEPAVRAETLRLAEVLRASEIAILGEVRNRAVTVSGNGSWPTAFAPEMPTLLIGARAIRQWSGRWTRSDSR